MFVLDGLDGLLESVALPHMPLATKVAAVGCEWLFSALPGAFADGFGSRQRVHYFSAWALHGSCPVGAQEHQRGSSCGGDEPQDEGDKNVHGFPSK